MNNIWNSVKLDYFILKSSDFRRIGIVSVAGVLAGAMSKNPPLIIGIIMMMSGFLISTIFAVVEKNNLNKLYGILPVERKQTAIGRYLFALLAGLVILALASILALAVSFIFKDALSVSLFISWLCGSFLIYCIMISLQFPLYFKYDFSKMAAFATLPYVLIIITGTFLIRKQPQLFGQLVKFYKYSPNMLYLLVIVGTLLLLGVSTIISIGLYKKREL